MSQKFYNIFRNKLSVAQESDVPMHIWENIQQEIPVYQKGGTKKYLWFFLGGLLLVGGLFWGMQFTAGSGQQAAGSEEQAAGSEESAVLGSQSSIHSSKSVGSEELAANSGQQAAVSEQLVPSSQLSVSSKQLAVLSSQSSGYSKESSVNSIHQAAGSRQNTASIEQLVDPNRQGIFEDNFVLEVEERLGLEENINVNETIKVKEKREHITLLNPLQEAYTSNLFIPKPDKDPVCYSFGQARGARFSLDVYGGPGYALRPFSSKNEDVSSYISAREQTESYQYAFQVGARLTMHLRHGLNVGLGLHYSQVGEKFDYTDPNDTRTVTTIIEIKDNAGNVIDTRTEEVILFGITIKEIYNRYHTIDIPILVGYDIALGKVGFGIKAGPVLNASSWQRGQFLDPTLEPKFIDLENPLEYFPAYKTTLGIGAYLGVNVEVPVSPSSSIFVEPHALHRFQTLTLDTYPINQNSTQLGLNFGLRFKL